MTRDTVLVAGSTAIDQTGLYAGDFAQYQARYPINALNMSFQLASMHTSFGGCAPNIAWGLTQLDVKALPLSSAGRNFQDRYKAHLIENNIDIRYIAVDDTTENCATCLMINDSRGNQIIGFYPGPESKARKLPSEIPEIDKVALAILGPEAPSLTLNQARDLDRLGIPVLFDPGQVVSDYGRTDIVELLSLADYLVINDYEFSVLQANSGLSATAICSQVKEVVVTNGAAGVEVHAQGQLSRIDAINDLTVVDVTGCGDAFRAGYAYGVMHQLDPRTRAEFGCIMAMLNLQTNHTQIYKTSLSEVQALRNQYYGQRSP